MKTMTAGLAGLACVVVAASCSLGLDESRITSDAGGPSAAFDGGGDASDASAEAAAPDAGRTDCDADEDCASAHGCLRGTCDTVRKRCVYDVCRPAACSAAVCDRAAKTCGEPVTYKLKATEFTLGARVACPRCVAALGSWLFAVTTTGLVAFDVSNPGSTTPAPVPVTGLGFVPTGLAQGGGRVWLVGAVTGDGPSRIQLAWLEPPTDPFSPTITAHTVLASYNRKAEPTLVYPRIGETALLVGLTAPAGAAVIDEGLAEPAAVAASPFTVVANYGPTAATGTRLLMGAVVNQAASFYFVDNIGTTTPSNGTVANASAVGAVSTQRVFAQGPDGSVFWTTGVHQGSGGGTTTRAARAFFVVANDLGPVDAQEGVDLEVYSGVGANAAIFGASQGTAAYVDGNTVLVATQAKENVNQTAVQFVTHFPFAVVKDGAGAVRRQVLPVRIADVVGTAGTRGIGFVVANGEAPTAPATAYVFDAACAP